MKHAVSDQKILPAATIFRLLPNTYPSRIFFYNFYYELSKETYKSTNTEIYVILQYHMINTLLHQLFLFQDKRQNDFKKSVIHTLFFTNIIIPCFLCMCIYSICMCMDTVIRTLNKYRKLIYYYNATDIEIICK